MTAGEIQVEAIHFYEETNEHGEDGDVWYLSLHPDPGRKTSCLAHPGKDHRFFRQPFAKRPFKADAKHPVPGRRHHIWEWDGNRESPTLTPSFVSWARYGNEPKDTRVHLFLRAGLIDLCGDSTVRVNPRPVPCEMPDKGDTR